MIYILGFGIWYVAGYSLMYFTLKFEKISDYMRFGIYGCDETGKNHKFNLDDGEKIECIFYGLVLPVPFLLFLIAFKNNNKEIFDYYKKKNIKPELTLKQLRKEKLKRLNRRRIFRWI